MSILTLSIDAELENFIESQVKNNQAENKSAVVRSALRHYREELELRDLMLARKEVEEGKVLKGDLRELLAQL
jgi:Arc/MetJ-type ribon-helix-helix transcriptional regulator